MGFSVILVGVVGVGPGSMVGEEDGLELLELQEYVGFSVDGL